LSTPSTSRNSALTRPAWHGAARDRRSPHVARAGRAPSHPRRAGTPVSPHGGSGETGRGTSARKTSEPAPTTSAARSRVALAPGAVRAPSQRADEMAILVAAATRGGSGQRGTYEKFQIELSTSSPFSSLTCRRT
jgi:hypothetical protein